MRRLAFDHPELADLDPGARRLALRSLVAQIEPCDEASVLVGRLSDDIDGYGRLTELMSDAEVNDIFVNGPNEIWSEKRGVLEREDISFEDEDELYRLIDRLLAGAGQRVDATKPLADARLTDGSRLHVALPPVAPGGPLVSIRRFPRARMQLHDLIERRMLSKDQAAYLASCVRDRRSLLISGGTGTGKTTFLNALLAHVPRRERVVLIEETPELEPDCAHHVSLLARGANEEGIGAVDLSSLLRAALRMRPDRIVVGEVRGAEASVALAAMSTGHPGSLLTIHASSAHGALLRLESLARQDGSVGGSSLKASIADAIELCVHLERRDGHRRVVEIVES